MAYKAKVFKAKSKEDFDAQVFQQDDGKLYGIKDAFKALARTGGSIDVYNGKKHIGVYFISYNNADNKEVKERFKKWLGL